MNILEIDLNNKNYKFHLRKVKKYIKNCDNKNLKFKIKYDVNIDKNIKKEFKLIESTINLKKLEERYSYIYDKVCEYLDEEYLKNNFCDFINDTCVYYRSIKEYNHKNGCCYSDKRGGLCENLDNNHCKISSISCKLYSCPILRENKINFKMKNIPLIKYFFNLKQKYFIKYSFFKPKSYVIYKLMECKNDKR